MIIFIFTLDYELYGSGSGSLKKCVLEPTNLLFNVFDKWRFPLVLFIEAAELEIIKRQSADKDIDLVLEQIQFLYDKGNEIGLHIHPQWYNARLSEGKWKTDNSEYNLCNLTMERIDSIVSQAIGFLRNVLKKKDFIPFSFRAGNWLFQPTQPAANILYKYGIRVDSSVFNGGRFREYAVDYRRVPKNRYYWRFEEDVVKETPDGRMLEIPIYSRMVPFWQMVTKKRFQLTKGNEPGQIHKKNLGRIKELFRLRYPKKLDFCRMTERELKETMEVILKEDRKSASIYKPIVAIGHTKDLMDIKPVEFLLKYLFDNRIPVSTFSQIYNRLI